MRHPNIRLTEDGGAAPYDYTQAKDASDDLDYSPEQYDDFELLEQVSLGAYHLYEQQTMGGVYRILAKGWKIKEQ